MESSNCLLKEREEGKASGWSMWMWCLDGCVRLKTKLIYAGDIPISTSKHAARIYSWTHGALSGKDLSIKIFVDKPPNSIIIIIHILPATDAQLRSASNSPPQPRTVENKTPPQKKTRKTQPRLCPSPRRPQKNSPAPTTTTTRVARICDHPGAGAGIGLGC